MLVIDSVDPVNVLALLGMQPPATGVAGSLWKKWTRNGTLSGVVAEQDDMPVGAAVVESRPDVLHVHILEGDPDPCRMLLHRLVRQAGERDMSAWCSTDRTDVQALLDVLGFTPRYQKDGATFYYWARNEDVEE